MAKKKASAEKPQGERFIEFAKSVGADDADALDRALREPKVKQKKKKKDGQSADG